MQTPQQFHSAVYLQAWHETDVQLALKVGIASHLAALIQRRVSEAWLALTHIAPPCKQGHHTYKYNGTGGPCAPAEDDGLHRCANSACTKCRQWLPMAAVDPATLPMWEPAIPPDSDAASAPSFAAIIPVSDDTILRACAA
jgi:hypothetical protein